MTATTARPQDPICGMMVSEASTHHTEHEGKTLYFCSDHCRQKFLSSPDEIQTTQPTNFSEDWRN